MTYTRRSRFHEGLEYLKKNETDQGRVGGDANAKKEKKIASGK
jgi:hypothetical protein